MAYTFLRDGAAFRRLMAFIMLTYSAALLVFFLFPTCQHLRPVFFKHRNLLTELTASIYANDTNTNVCPSIHVIGSLAVWLAARDMKGLPAAVRRGIIPVTALLICASTVFLKQHSALDVLAAVAVCAAGYPLVYRRRAVETAVLRREAAAGRRKYPQI